MQKWTLLTRSQCRVPKTQVTTIRDCGSLFFFLVGTAFCNRNIWLISDLMLLICFKMFWCLLFVYVLFSWMRIGVQPGMLQHIKNWLFIFFPESLYSVYCWGKFLRSAMWPIDLLSVVFQMCYSTNSDTLISISISITCIQIK